jgi:putative ABC transport system ATP-binding protein
VVDAPAVIKLKGVTKSYMPRGGQPFQALRGINLDVCEGEFVAVLGKSGSGKSTLLNVIAGLDRSSSGEVTAAGETLNRLNENCLALWRGRNVGVVFQFFQLLPTLTIIENILLAMDFVDKVPGAARRARAHDLLELVGLSDQAAKLPATLSGGQQQRAAIARALANDPPIVLADEPTGNLDSETAGAVTELFQGLIERGKTLIIVTHDDNLARRAHRIIPAQGWCHCRGREQGRSPPVSAQWRKVSGDFREHRLQMFLIGLVLALGTASVVAALNARAILQREIAKSYRSALSADVVLWFDKVEPELLSRVRSQSRVAAADARRVAFTRVEGKSGALFPMQLTIVPDFANRQVGLLHPHQTAAWPP